MEEMMYLNGEKPGAGGGRGRGRGGPGDRGRGGLLTSPAGRGAPPPRSALLHTLKLLHRSFFVNYLAIPKSVLVVGTPLQLVKFCRHWYRKIKIKYLPESFKKLLKSLEISFFGLKNKLGMGNSHVFGSLEYTDIYVNKLLYTE